MSALGSLPATDPDAPLEERARRASWQDVDWRAHQRWVQIEGRPVNTIELGAGRPLVFVHGLSGSWPNWLEQLAAFSDRYRVIAMDLPGFGHSPMPVERITISTYARIVDGLLGALEVTSATIVGNSMGGFIAAQMAIAHPQRVERMVLVSAAGISTHRHPGVERALPSMRRLDRLVKGYAQLAAANADRLARRRGTRNAALGLVVRHPSRLPAALAAEQIRGAGKPGFMQALQANIDYPIRERLCEVACPTLIVWGEEDKLIPVADADLFESLISDSRKVVFKDTGHMAMLERPAAFNELLLEFLGESSAS